VSIDPQITEIKKQRAEGNRTWVGNNSCRRSYAERILLPFKCVRLSAF